MVARTPARDRSGDACKNVFCNRACYDAFREAIWRSGRTCLSCGASIDAPARAAAKYCSLACRVEHRKPQPRPCVNCGCVFTPVKPMRRGGDRVEWIAHDGGKTCSRACQIAWISNNEERKDKIGRAFAGRLHPNWQGGKSLLNNASYRGQNWAKQRERAIRRDGGICADCGVTRDECREKFGRDMDVDHIVPFHNFGNSRKANRLGNLLSRCASCHRKAEAKRHGVQMVLPFANSANRRHKGYAIGERHPRAKISASDVVAIRASTRSLNGLAADYGLSKSAVSSIRQGKTWKCIPSIQPSPPSS